MSLGREQFVAASCRGKEAFTSWALAEAAAKRARRHKDIRVAPYHCTVCDLVHVGSKQKAAS